MKTGSSVLTICASCSFAVDKTSSWMSTLESVLCRTNQRHGNQIYHCNLVFQTTEPAINHTGYLSLNSLVILAYNFSFLSFYQELSAIAPATNDTPEDPDNIDIQ
jgi:hypothetical protein